MKQRLRPAHREAGFTLVELLVASAMSIVVIGAVGAMVVSAMRDQPQISKRAQNISDARWALERLTHEIRIGAVVDKASSSSVSFQTYVRHAACGGTALLPSTSPSIKCEVTYTCSATTKSCTRKEAAPGDLTGGTARTIFSGIGTSEVFCYVPSNSANPSNCGPPSEKLRETTFIGARLYIPNPRGGSGMTVSDGASLRNAILTD